MNKPEEMWLQFRIKHLNKPEKEIRKHFSNIFGFSPNLEKCRNHSKEKGETYIDMREVFFDGKCFIGKYTFGNDQKDKMFDSPEEAFEYANNLPFNPVTF